MKLQNFLRKLTFLTKVGLIVNEGAPQFVRTPVNALMLASKQILIKFSNNSINSAGPALPIASLACPRQKLFGRSCFSLVLVVFC